MEIRFLRQQRLLKAARCREIVIGKTFRIRTSTHFSHHRNSESGAHRFASAFLDIVKFLIKNLKE